jgi:hypothetical protein
MNTKFNKTQTYYTATWAYIIGNVSKNTVNEALKVFTACRCRNTTVAPNVVVLDGVKRFLVRCCICQDVSSLILSISKKAILPTVMYTLKPTPNGTDIVDYGNHGIALGLSGVEKIWNPI